MAQRKKTTAPKKNTAKKGTPSAPETRPIRREVGAVTCLFLGIFSIIGYFDVEALFLDIFCGFVKGMVGWGYYIFPPALLFCAGILAFHKGRPVRLRVFSVFMLPVMFGAFLHLILFKSGYGAQDNLIQMLYVGGQRMINGGVISGLLAIGFEKMFSIYGAAPVFLLSIIFFVLIAGNLSVQSLVQAYRERNVMPYEVEPVIERPRPEYPPRRIAEPPVPQKRRRRIDIPLDDDMPMDIQEENETTFAGAKREGFFNRKPRVRTPDEVLTPPDITPLELEDISLDAIPDPIIMESPIDEHHFVQPSTSIETEREPVKEMEKEAIAQEIADPPKPTGKKRLNPKEVEAETVQIARTIASEMQVDHGAYTFPPLSLLQAGGKDTTDARDEITKNRGRIETALKSFGVNATIVDVTRGPTVTRYDLELETGVKLNKLTGLSDDLALSLGVSAVRISPIPNKISTVGIEVPNKSVSTIYLRDIIDSGEFCNARSKLSFAIGKDISGKVIVGDIAKLPHLLIAGTTGSGKSVCVNSMILSMLYKSTPDEVRFIMIDPKMVEFVVYNEIPHLYIPVVTDPKKAAGALQWAVVEMMKRYRLFSEAGVRDLAGYNKYQRQKEEKTLPQVVIVIDELADLMIAAAKEVEESICRVAQMGRASGMHLVIATQRPSADVITGLMKANIPSRIALFVRSAMDSRIILDAQGADKLVGNGDMLYLPVGAGKPHRVQGAWVSDEERESVVNFVKSNGESQYDETILEEIERASDSKSNGKPESSEMGDGYDELLADAVQVIFDTKQASVSMLQRRLKLGYARAARIVDQMEELGVVGASEGSKPRQILMTQNEWERRFHTSDHDDTEDDEELDDMPPFDLEDRDETEITEDIV